MKNMFPSCFYFNLFFTSKYFLSGHNSKEEHFFLSETVVHCYLSEAVTR